MAQGQRTDIQPSANLQKVSQAKAAGMLNVSTRLVAAKLANIPNGGDMVSERSANLQTGAISQAKAAGMLNVSTRLVAAKLETLKQGRPGKDANLHDSVSRAKAADMLNVSTRGRGLKRRSGRAQSRTALTMPHRGPRMAHSGLSRWCWH